MGRLILPLGILGVVCVAVFGARVHESVLNQASRTFSDPRQLCKIEDNRVNESSGVSADAFVDGLYYTHNDSGDSARFFAFDSSGKVLRSYTLSGAKALDWEDMDLAVIGGKQYLYFGDIGDNSKKRENIVIYQTELSESAGAELPVIKTLTVSYPDGPQNAEAMFVRPGIGDIYIVTKAANAPAGVYKLKAPESSGTFQLTKIGQVKLAEGIAEAQLITGGGISPDGKYIILRTYLSAFEFAAPVQFDDWTKQTPKKIKIALEAQGEAICYSRDGKALITTSEGSPCPVHRIDIR